MLDQLKIRSCACDLRTAFQVRLRAAVKMTDGYGALEVEAAPAASEPRRAGGYGARVAVLLLGAAAMAGVARLTQGRE